MELLLLLDLIQWKEEIMWQYILYFNSIRERDQSAVWIRANYGIQSDKMPQLEKHYVFYRSEKLSRDDLLMLVNAVQPVSYLENRL